MNSVQHEQPENSRQILIVDDDADFVESLEEILESRDFHTIVAHNKKQALEKISENNISVAILDLVLPDSPGIALISSLKQQNENCVCIILTGHADVDSAVEALKSGAFQYIQKPVHPEELLEVLDRAFNIVQLKEEKAASDRALKSYKEQLEELVEFRTAELESANKELEAFCYSVSHDLRAPLRTIHGFSSALREDFIDQLGDEGKDFLTRIEKAALRMEGLIENFLSLSRMTQQEMVYKPVSLTEIAENVCRQLDETNTNRDINVTIQSNLSGYGDESMLRIALENLFSNAYKFTAKNSQTHIEFGLQPNNKQARFFIKDDGVGFNVKQKDKLFAPFQRLHAPEDFPGSGIGLATVQRIIHRHGGRIWAEPGNDKGAIFYFTLPNRIG